MGYGRALLQRDVKKEEESLQKKAKKKSLWGSIGRTIGGLGAMALTGGVVNPWTIGLITAGATYAGGVFGAKASKTGDLSKQGKFFKADRESIQKEIGAFGTQNLVSSLTAGITAGIGQKLKLAKAVKTPPTKPTVGVDTGIGEGFDMPWETAEISSDSKLTTSADLWSPKTIWDKPSGVAKVPQSPPMESVSTLQGFKTKFQDYIGPGTEQMNVQLAERYPDMFEGSSVFPKKYTNGMSTVIGSK